MQPLIENAEYGIYRKIMFCQPTLESYVSECVHVTRGNLQDTSPAFPTVKCLSTVKCLANLFY